MEFDLLNAILAGLAGTAAITVLGYMMIWMTGKGMDFATMLGTMLLPKGPPAFSIGMGWHFVNGVIFFIIYAALFDWFGITGDGSVVLWAAIFSLVHSLVVGMMMGMMGMMHPRIETGHASGPEIGMRERTAGGSRPETVPDPGFFGLNQGPMMPLMLFVMHAIFAVTAAAVYVLI